MVEAKNLVIGAATQLIPKSISHITYNYLVEVQKIPPEELKKTFWYTEPLGPGLPAADDWICDIGIPAVLGIVGGLTRREDLMEMALGAALTRGATFLHVLLSRLPALLGG